MITTVSYWIGWLVITAIYAYALYRIRKVERAKLKAAHEDATRLHREWMLWANKTNKTIQLLVESDLPKEELLKHLESFATGVKANTDKQETELLINLALNAKS